MSEAPVDDEVSARRRAREEAGIDAVTARALAAADAANTQALAYAARDFVMCSLPFRQPPKGTSSYKRQNGEILLEIQCSSERGMPYGQDRLIPIWLATAFFAAGKPKDNVIRLRCAKDILRAFNLDTEGGRGLARLHERLARIFYSTYFVSTIYTDARGNKADKRQAYRLMTKIAMYTSDHDARTSPNQYTLWQDEIVLGHEFAEDLRQGGRVPIDLDTVKALKECSPALDLYVWQAWRSYRLQRAGEESVAIPIFGPEGLVAQLGSRATKPKIFKAMLRGWQHEVKRVWPDCPNYLDDHCERFIAHPGAAHDIDKRVPELPGVSPTPPPRRKLAGDADPMAPEPGQIILVRDDEHASANDAGAT
jgi:hypothetical protein